MFASVFREFGTCSYALIAFLACWKVGKHFDDDAEKRFKDEFRQALKSASWFAYLKLSYTYAGEVLDHFFGPRISSIFTVFVSAVITIIATILTAVFFYFHHYDFYDAAPLRFSIYFATLRLLPAILIDYLTLLRVRLLCRKISAGQNILGLICVSVALDVMTFGLLFELVQAILIAESSLRYPVEDGPALQNVIRVFTHASYILDGAIRESGGLRIFAVTSAVGAIGALAPALIFYLYTCSLVALRLLCGFGSAAASISTRMRFRQPFTSVGVVAGAILAAVIGLLGRL